jgi:Fusaric acid resistance protein family
MWDIAVNRVEEIGLGIAGATVVASVVFPRPLGPMLSRSLHLRSA